MNREHKPFYDPQERYRTAKRAQGAVYLFFAVFMFLFGLIFDKSVMSGSLYVFIYGLGYYFGRRGKEREQEENQQG